MSVCILNSPKVQQNCRSYTELGFKQIVKSDETASETSEQVLRRLKNT